LFWGVIFIALDYSLLQKEIVAVRDFNKYHATTLQLNKQEGEESHIIPDSTIVFLGKTKNYFYLYDKKKEAAVIVSSGEVLKVELKNKYRWVWEYPK